MQLSLTALRALEDLVNGSDASNFPPELTAEVLAAIRLDLRARRTLNSIDLAAIKAAEGRGDVQVFDNPGVATGARRPPKPAPKLFAPSLEDLGLA